MTSPPGAAPAAGREHAAGREQTDGRPHPRHDLDPLLLHGVRFSLLAVVLTAGKVAFSWLREELEVSDSVLSKQLTALEEAGYVTVDKVAEGRRARTWVSGTAQGRRAFARHRDALQVIAGP